MRYLILISVLFLTACGGSGGGGGGGSGGGSATVNTNPPSSEIAMSQLSVSANGQVAASAIDCGNDGCSAQGYLDIQD